MNKDNVSINRIKIGLVIVLLTALTGCAGFWGGSYYGEGYYGEGVMEPEPDMYLFGGDYYSGREVHRYSHRGSESRGAAYHGGNHWTGHSSGGARR